VSEVEDEGEEVLEYPADHHQSKQNDKVVSFSHQIFKFRPQMLIQSQSNKELQKLMSFLRPNDNPPSTSFHGAMKKVLLQVSKSKIYLQKVNYIFMPVFLQDGFSQADLQDKSYLGAKNEVTQVGSC